jgi:NADH dehydrogenase
LSFHDPGRLAGALEGVSVLHNTYWVRFNHRTFTHAQAVDNTRTLFEAARTAGVDRIVHVSITNPDEGSDLEYFRGKARIEAFLRESGLPHSILRPAVLFGKEDVLINNIAWMLRRFPAFGLFGDGNYRLQPIYVDDLAALAVEHGAAAGNLTVEAIGPETFTYRELVGTIGRAIGRRRPVFSMPPLLGRAAAGALGFLLGDVVVTREEIQGLMEERLYVDAPPAGATRLSSWAAEQADSLGVRYASELARRRPSRRAADQPAVSRNASM